MSESAPIAWQEIGGHQVFVQVAFCVFEITDANLQSKIENPKSASAWARTTRATR
jgi:hypothetical protein